jgi:hypothetical protein
VARGSFLLTWVHLLAGFVAFQSVAGLTLGDVMKWQHSLPGGARKPLSFSEQASVI